MKLPSWKAIGGLLLASAIVVSLVPDTPQAAARQRSADATAANEQRRRSAFLAARRMMETRLKSPATADWSSYPATTITEGDGGQLVVSGWVDSHNSFGAQVRTKYILTLAPEGDSWRAVDIRLP